MPKEYGSDFHFINFFEKNSNSSIQEIYPRSQLYFSGRAALFNIIKTGIELYNWKRIYLPEYYCHDVDEFIKFLPVDICYYSDGPYIEVELDFIETDKDTNVFVHVNYFGFNEQSRLNFKHAFIIEDHTHDLASNWALNSTAHYCFASLRKSLPVPAGGIIWSPKLLNLPESPQESELSNLAVYMKLSAMLLKQNYLEDGNVDKQDFRNLYMNSELFFEKQETNAALPLIICKAINNIPVQLLRRNKINNYKILSSAIKRKNLIWQKDLNEKQCPFGLIFLFDDEQERNAMKNYLIENKIYAAVLWPNQQVKNAIDFSARILFIHCDDRYNLADMQYIAESINNL